MRWCSRSELSWALPERSCCRGVVGGEFFHEERRLRRIRTNGEEHRHTTTPFCSAPAAGARAGARDNPRSSANRAGMPVFHPNCNDEDGVGTYMEHR
jgi:hypothetical protein